MAKSLRAAFAIFAIGLMSSCARPQAASPAVGDTCLVGSWTEVNEVNSSAYGVNGESVAVAGFQGTALTIKSEGTEALSFQESAPLNGVTSAGSHLQITVRGGVTFHIHGDGHKFTETGTGVNLPTQATLDGKPIQYQSYYYPGRGTYSCAAHSLTTTTVTGVQTNTWSRP
jgi:hypothetical protein